ncbi:MAG TPA: CoA ester lyase [Candidatus Binataceae bacterium]|nr:CoA ester lyase [Candidatus Binataceae bacterium]HVB82578.1 CoA ester lyase [Candidatus Binataceae bacterium]
MYLLDHGRFMIPRTELSYPGHNLKLHQNAADPVKAPVDLAMADLEDACPYEFKGERSRRVVVEAFNTLDFGAKAIAVRPNGLHSQFFQGDLEALMLGAPNRFHGVVLPKVRGAEEIVTVARLLDDLERRGGWQRRVQIEALIETPQGLINAHAIASASERMCGLIFGIADFAAALGVREIVEDQNRNFHYAKQAMAVAAKAAGLHAMDNVYLRLWRKDDPPARVAEIERGLREKNLGAAKLGMDGTWVIHPQQAEIANACFTPSAEQVAEARRVVELYHRNGGGSMADPNSGSMIDEATVKIALVDLARGAQAGMVTDSELREWSEKSRAITGYDILELMRRVA